MKRRKKRIILTATAVVLATSVFLGWYWRYTTTTEYKARKLVAELRKVDKEPSMVERCLTKLRLTKWQDAPYEELQEGLVALGQSAVPPLIQALKDENRQVRCRAAWSLGAIGPKAKEAAAALIKATRDDYCGVRSSAVYALASIVPEAEETVPALLEALKDEDEDVRSAAAWALGRIGPPAREAVPALSETLKDKDEKVRQAAAEALKRIEESSSP